MYGESVFYFFISFLSSVLACRPNQSVCHIPAVQLHNRWYAQKATRSMCGCECSVIAAAHHNYRRTEMPAKKRIRQLNRSHVKIENKSKWKTIALFPFYALRRRPSSSLIATEISEEYRQRNQKNDSSHLAGHFFLCSSTQCSSGGGPIIRDLLHHRFNFNSCASF